MNNELLRACVALPVPVPEGTTVRSGAAVIRRIPLGLRIPNSEFRIHVDPPLA